MNRVHVLLKRPWRQPAPTGVVKDIVELAGGILSNADS